MTLCAITIQLQPIPLLLKCPRCQAPHVDEGDWARTPHREHLCAKCDHKWRPANVHTVGVENLPLCGIMSHEDTVVHLVSIALAPALSRPR